MKYFILFVIAFVYLLQINILQAKMSCEPLHPKLQEKDIVINGKIKAEAKGFMSKILGAEGQLDGNYFNQDSLSKYPDSDKLAKWYSIIYITCGMLNEKSYTTDQRILIFNNLITLYSSLVGLEEKITPTIFDDNFKSLSVQLSKLKIGRSASSLGKNLIIRKGNGYSFLSGKQKLGNAVFEIKNLNLQSDKRVDIKLMFYLDAYDIRKIILLTKSGKKITTLFTQEKLKFEGEEKDIYYSGYKMSHQASYNIISFEIDKTEIILSINDKLVNSIEKKPNMVIDTIIIKDISKNDSIIDLSISDY